MTDLICRYSTSLCMQKVQHELLTKYENHLLEKEHSGCDALLRDDKVNKVLLNVHSKQCDFICIRLSQLQYFHSTLL
jgi:hypothetical protein